MKMTALRWGMVGLCAATVSCGDGGGDPPALDTYFAPGTAYATASCNAVDGRLTGQREMHLYYAGSVNVATLTQGLARYYQRHGLTFVASAQPQAIPTAYALDTNDSALTNALVQQFPNANFNDEAALM